MESRGVAGSGRFIAAAAADAPVQIAAGVLILLGVLLGYTVNGGFFLLSGAVGAGLTFAGVTGFLRHGASAGDHAVEPAPGG